MLTRGHLDTQDKKNPGETQMLVESVIRRTVNVKRHKIVTAIPQDGDCLGVLMRLNTQRIFYLSWRRGRDIL